MTEEERGLEQNNPTGDPDVCKPCPNCGMRMEMGALQTGGKGATRVFIEPQSAQESQSEYIQLSVCFCRDCGKVVLFTEE